MESVQRDRYPGAQSGNSGSPLLGCGGESGDRVRRPSTNTGEVTMERTRRQVLKTSAGMAAGGGILASGMSDKAKADKLFGGCYPSNSAHTRLCAYKPDGTEWRSHRDTPSHPIPVGKFEIFVGNTSVFNMHVGVWKERGRWNIWIWESKIVNQSVVVNDRTLRGAARKASRVAGNMIDDAVRYTKSSRVVSLLRVLGRYIFYLIWGIAMAACAISGACS